MPRLYELCLLNWEYNHWENKTKSKINHWSISLQNIQEIHKLKGEWFLLEQNTSKTHGSVGFRYLLKITTESKIHNRITQ